MAFPHVPSMYDFDFDENGICLPALLFPDESIMQFDLPNDVDTLLNGAPAATPSGTTDSSSPCFTPSEHSDSARSNSLPNSFTENRSLGLDGPLSEQATSSASSHSSLLFPESDTQLYGSQEHVQTGLSADIAYNPVIEAPAESQQAVQTRGYSKQKPKTQVARCKSNEKSYGKQRRGAATRKDVLKSDKNPRIRTESDFEGRIRGIYTTFGHGQNVRASFSKLEQKATKQTREIGACRRCRNHRQRCDRSPLPWQPCKRCASIPSIPLDRAICIRVHLPDLSLHRRGSTLNDNLLNWTIHKERELDHDLLDWNSFPDASQVIHLTQEMGLKLPVTVSRFDVEPGDTTGYHWADKDGRPRQLDMLPIYISDLVAVEREMRNYGSRSTRAYIQALVGSANPIITRTFEAACNYVEEFNKSSLVSEALRFWTATRLTERTWHITWDNPLGLQPIDEQDNPWNGTIPVTPIMDTQLDELAIRALLNPLRERITRRLQEKIDDYKKENWFEIYLTCFILLCNTEFILSDVIDFSARHSIKSSSNKGASLSEGYFHACQTILAHFHYVCNGSAPFLLSPPQGDDDSTLLTSNQSKYLQEVKDEVALQKNVLSQWPKRSMYKSEMHFCYQLLCKDWRGDIPHAGEMYDYTEEDFLTS